MDILTGDGEVVTATPDGEHADLFRTFPNSYGSPRLRAPGCASSSSRCTPYVALRHVRFDDLDALRRRRSPRSSRPASGTASAVDFLDGVVFAPGESYLTLAAWADCRRAPGRRPSDYTGQQIYYRSIQRARARPAHHLRLPLALGHRLVLVLAAPSARSTRSSGGCGRAASGAATSTTSSSASTTASTSSTGSTAARGQPRARARRAGRRDARSSARPSSSTGSTQQSAMSPGVAVPAALRAAPSRAGRSYPLEPGRTYVNVGFWGTVPIVPGRARRRTQPGHRGRGRRARRPQVALLRRLLRPRRPSTELYGGADYAGSSSDTTRDHGCPRSTTRRCDAR